MLSSSNEGAPKRPLRSHKKSRFGCRRCKDRKVKCDERHPICGNCSKRYGSLEPCEFDGPEFSPRYGVDSNSASSSGSPPQLPCPPPQPALTLLPRDNMRILELKLFHHYTSLTSSTLPRYGRTEMDQFHRTQVPQLCFSSDVVLSAVLGLAAMNYLTVDPENTDMKRAARWYLDKTIRQHSRLVSQLSEETAEPAMLVAMLIVVEMRLRAVYVGEDEPYRLPLEYFHMHRGATALYYMCIPFLQGSNVLVALGVEPAEFGSDPPASDCLPSVLLEDSQSLLDGLDAEGIDPRDIATYKGGISYLNVLYMALLREEEPQWTRRRLFGMPAQVPRGFVNLLEQQEPRAMAILARFLALMKLCDGPIYYPGTAEYEVLGIMSLMPANWLWAMEWPLQILRLSKLADCEAQEVMSDSECFDYQSGEEFDYSLANEACLYPAIDGEDLSQEAMLSSSSYSVGPLTPPDFQPVGGNVCPRISTPVRRCMEMRPLQRERVILETEEIFARHRASGECSLEQCCHIFSHPVDQMDGLKMDK